MKSCLYILLSVITMTMLPCNVALADNDAESDTINTHKHPYFNWKRDITYAAVPALAVAFLVNNQQTNFNSARIPMSNTSQFKQLETYTQFLPYAEMIGMKVFGYHGRSDWGRFLASAAASNAIMFGLSQGLKHAMHETRPDCSDDKSFPSGHAATAFTAATIMHLEYGKTRSPWFSVGSYTMATATSALRVMKNYHHAGDVFAGAGIGILSAELGYWLMDLAFREKGIKHWNKSKSMDSDRPSFFDVQMGVGLHSSSIDFGDEAKVNLGTSTIFGLEGAYFYNKHWGVGGALRLTVTPTEGLQFESNDGGTLGKYNALLSLYDLPGIYGVKFDNNNFVDASADVGMYFNQVLSKHFSMTAKALIGFCLNGGIKYTAENGFRKGSSTAGYWYEDSKGNQFQTLDDLSATHSYVVDESKEHYDTYDILNVRSAYSFNGILGVSLSYRYSDNFAWKVFCDFDVSRKHYEYTFTPLNNDYLSSATLSKYPDVQEVCAGGALSTSLDKWSNMITIGGAMNVTF